MIGFGSIEYVYKVYLGLSIYYLSYTETWF
jgi:hypothetical protein